MKNTRVSLSSALILLVFAVVGCFPMKRMVWSPDGKQAAILTESGLYLSDPDGHLSGPLLPEVVLVRWFPDSKRLALAQGVKCQSWEEVQPLLTTETREKIQREGQAVIEKLKSGVEFNLALAAPQVPEEDKSMVGVYLRSTDGVKALAGQNWSFLESIEIKQYTLLVATIADGKVTPGQPLARSLNEIAEARISPDGTNIAFVAGEKGALSVVPADGSAPAKTVADFVAYNPDWTPDGRSLVYIRAIGALAEKDGDDLHLGALARSSVINQAGTIEIQPKPDDLAGVLFNPLDKVRCLRDGRIIFSALPVHLPVTKADMPQREQIYALDPDRQATLTPLIPQGVQGQIPENVSFFEVSPDEKRISLIGEKAAVAVLTIASGEVQVVQAPNTDHPKSDDYDTVPVWRTTNELSFLYLETTNDIPKKAQIGVWSGGKIKVISDSWPVEIRKSWLDRD